MPFRRGSCGDRGVAEAQKRWVGQVPRGVSRVRREEARRSAVGEVWGGARDGLRRNEVTGAKGEAGGAHLGDPASLTRCIKGVSRPRLMNSESF